MSEEKFHSYKELEVLLRNITIWGCNRYRSSMTKVKVFLPAKLMFQAF